MSNTHIINLSAYTSPVITESKRNEWVDYGSDNNYYSYLIDRYNNSTTNNAIINNISRLLYGRGLSVLNSGKYPNEYAQVVTLFEADDIRKMFMDLYMLGATYIQVIYSKDRKKVVKVAHSPTMLWRSAKCNEEGEIDGYFYSDDWTDTRKFKPTFYPAFGTSNEPLEVLCIRPYSVGMKYYSLVDYQGALPYALLEEEISNYLINEVKNGFSGTKVINFNNGIPDEEAQQVIKTKTLSAFTGSTGQRAIIAFNNNTESKTTVDDIPLNDAPAHYEYLSNESRAKIMLSHNVTSPLIFGIATNTGFSSNADELNNSAILFENMVIRPKQELLLDGFAKILAYNGVVVELRIETLNPLDAQGDITKNNNATKVIDGINSLSPLVANKVLESMTANEIRQLVGLPPEQGGSDLPTVTQMSSHIDHLDLNNYGEDLDLNEWELIDVRNVDYDEEMELDAQLEKANNPTLLSKIVHFATTGVAIPKRSSEQDGKLFVSRYRYMGEVSANSREFCKKMIQANKLYRKEDIMAMSANPKTNGEWSAKGESTYDIFLFKGGGACHHYWQRETYRKKGTDLSSPLKQQVTPAQARKEGEILPTNDKRVYQKPVDMPNQGFLNR